MITTTLPRFGGYLIKTITPEEKAGLRAGAMWNGINTHTVKRYYPEMKDVEYFEPYIPTTEPHTLYLFTDDEAGDHATQFYNIMTKSSEARHNFIANLKK